MSIFDPEIMKILNEYSRNIPPDLKERLFNEYKNKEKRLDEYLIQERDIKEQGQILSGVIKSHQGIIDKCVNAIKKLLVIYKKKNLGDLRLAGIQINFEYENPDPENLLGKISAGEKLTAYHVIGTLIKNIMDGDGDLSKFVPNLDDRDTWKPSFKYWQIYAALVNALLNTNKKVNLSVLESIDGLEKYQIPPFENVQHDKETAKKSTSSKKKKQRQQRKQRGGQRPQRDQKQQKDQRPQRDQSSDKGQKQQGDRKVDTKKLINVMGNIKFEDEENNIDSLWNNANNKLKYKLYNGNIYDKFKCLSNNFNIELRDKIPISAIDPITNEKYSAKDLKSLLPNNTETLVFQEIKNFLSNLPNKFKTKSTSPPGGTTPPGGTPQGNSWNDIIKDAKDDIKNKMNIYNDLIEVKDKSLFQKGNELIQDGDLKKILSTVNMYKFYIKKKICETYSLKVISYLQELQSTKNEFTKLRENFLITLIGYYAYSIKVINDFIKYFENKYVIPLKMIEQNKQNNKSTNKLNNRQKNTITSITTNKSVTPEMRNRNSVISKFGDKEKRILEKVDAIMAKLPPRSKQRAVILKKREEIVEMLIEKKKKEMKEMKEMKESKSKSTPKETSKKNTNESKKNTKNQNSNESKKNTKNQNSNESKKNTKNQNSNKQNSNKNLNRNNTKNYNNENNYENYNNENNYENNYYNNENNNEDYF